MTTIATASANESSLSPSSADYAYIAVHVCLFVATVATNVVTLVVIATTPRLQTIPNMYIATLTCADLLVAVDHLVFIPWRHPAYHGYFEENFLLCSFLMVSVHLAPSVSISTVFLIAAERLLYIKFPFVYLRVVTKKKVTVAIIVTWVTCIAYAACYRVFRFEASRYLGCSLMAIVYDSDLTARLSGIAGMMFTVVLFFLYAILLRTAAKQAKAIRNSHQLGVIRSSPKTLTLPEDAVRRDATAKATLNVKAVQRMAGVFICFCICWTPAYFVSLIGPSTVGEDIVMVALILAMFNSVSNFGVYALADREFCAAVARLMRIKTNSVSDTSA